MSHGTELFDGAALSPRARMADEVYDLILRGLLEGRARAGDRLSVPALAERLGVSRTPVREAIQRLVREGLAVEQPHRGAVIARFDTPELVEIYELREVLEGLAARLAASRASDAQVAQLRDALGEHAAAISRGDIAEHPALDMRFHRLMCDAAGNENLTAALAALQSKIRLAMLSTTLSAGADAAVADHASILEAIAGHDPARAERAARDHIARLTLLLREPAV